MPDKDREFIDKVLDHVDTDYEAIDDQRILANEDLRFVDVDGGMWEGWLEDQFANRPKFELNKVTQGIYRYLGEWSLNRFTVKYRPDDGETSEDDAELLNGLFRKDYRRSGGESAVDNGVSEQGKCGVGAVKLSTEFIDPEDIDNGKQRITFNPIHTAFNTVIWDSNAKMLDKSDAMRCTLLTEYAVESFEAEWPDAATDSLLQVKDKRYFNWQSKKSIYVGEYYEIEEKKEKAIIYELPETGERKTYYKEDLDGVMDDLADRGFKKVGERRSLRRKVYKTVLTSSDILEPRQQIAGIHIPIAPFYGFHGYVDGQEFFYGLARKRKDENRLLNMQVSTIAETAATSPKRVPIVTPEQMEGLEQYWSEIHLGKYNYALLNPLTDEQGQVIQMGALGYVEPPSVDPNAAALIQITMDSIREETGGNPQDTIDPKTSGKAINAVVSRVDMQNQPLMENIAVGLRRVAEIYRHMAKDVYSEQRLANILSEDGSESATQLFEAVLDQETGEIKVINDVTTGAFEVVVDTGSSFASQKQQTLQTLRELNQETDPNSEYAPFLFASIVENLEGTGIDELKKYNQRIMLQRGLREPKNDEEKALLQKLQQEQNQPDANEQLVQAAAEKEQAEARNLDASVAEKESKVMVNKATVAEKIAGIERADLQGKIGLLQTLSAPAPIQRRLN